jgi:hypothetical protein
VHGTVSAPFSSPPRRYMHAWVERGGTVYDWQTMVAGHGGKYRGIGYPVAVFYDLYKPTDVTRYTTDEALTAFARSRGGRESGLQHYGPWKTLSLKRKLLR